MRPIRIISKLGLHNDQACSDQLAYGRQADERTGNLSEFTRIRAGFQGWFAGAALAPAESTLPPDGRGDPLYRISARGRPCKGQVKLSWEHSEHSEFF